MKGRGGAGECEGVGRGCCSVGAGVGGDKGGVRRGWGHGGGGWQWWRGAGSGGGRGC